MAYKWGISQRFTSPGKRPSKGCPPVHRAFQLGFSGLESPESPKIALGCGCPTLRISGTLQEIHISHLGKFGKSSTQICRKSGGYVNSLEVVYHRSQLGDEKNHRSHPIFWGNQETSLFSKTVGGT